MTETKILFETTRELIKSYAKIPYYNNKRKEIRFGLRAFKGKGLPSEILEEATLCSLQKKIDLVSLGPELFKKFLVDHNLGIDCSGLAFHILDFESQARGKGTLAKSLEFPFAGDAISRFNIFVFSRYVENAGTRTFAHDQNSKEIVLLDTAPGDIICMLDSGQNGETNHIMVINKVELVEAVPVEINYVHSIAWPSDGRYGHGVREGKIWVKNINHPLLDQTWNENAKINTENFTYHKAIQAKHLSLRRLNWFD